MATTLLLNASYEPIKVITWERAVTLFFLGKVEVVDTYSHEIRSVSLAIRAPAVVRLLRYVQMGRKRPPLSKLNLLARDEFKCQYCNTQLSRQNSTVDHVIPKSQGGRTSWENCVISCHNCNRKKGGNTPEQARMHLLKPAEQPDWLPVLSVRFHSNLPTAWLVFLR